jgi:acyl-CoA synthetase (AMP-forming)/AMP-acid ligase II
MLYDLIEQVRPFLSFPHILQVLIGAGKIYGNMLNIIEKMFPNANIIMAYGMTECCSTISFSNLLSSNSFCAKISGLIGKPTNGISIMFSEIIDEFISKDFEIFIKGTVVAVGFFSASALGFELRRVGAITRDRWFRTGDTAKLVCDYKSDPRLILSGRLKDFIKTGGENVNIGILENELCYFPGCKENSVFSISDSRLNEIICVIYKLRQSYSGNRDEVAKYCKINSISGFKIPQFIFFSKKLLPRNVIGKISKDILSKAAFICLKAIER